MKRDQAIAKAREMREQGYSYEAIAKAVGRGVATVYRWLNPEYAEQSRAVSRAWKERNAGTCQSCGGPTNASKGIGTAAEVCMPCRTWTPEAILLALQGFYGEHGRSPVIADGHPGASGHGKLPNAKPVERVFGSWNGGLLAAGLPLNLDRRPETQEAIEAALRAGESAVEIADRYGWTPANVAMRLRTRGLSATKLRTGWTPQEREAELIRCWHAGWSSSDIAEHLGYASARCVDQRISRLRGRGVDLPYRHRHAVANAAKARAAQAVAT